MNSNFSQVVAKIFKNEIQIKRIEKGNEIVLIEWKEIL